MRTPFHCEVAGLYYHLDKPQEGTFSGYTKADPTNKYDKNAIGVYSDAGDLLGYIPATETKAFRIWNLGKSDIPITYKMSQYKEYDGTIHWTATIDLVDANLDSSPIVLGKKIALSGDFLYAPKNIVKAILTSYGAIIGNRTINRKTDFVIYDNSLEMDAMDLKDNPEYHFEIISFWDLMQKILQDKPHNEFYGKKVAMWNSFAPDADYRKDEAILLDFMIESGAKVGKYSKKDTEIVIDERAYQRKMSKDASELGKQVVFIEDIYLNYFNFDISQYKKQQEASQIDSSNEIVVNLNDVLAKKIKELDDTQPSNRVDNSKKGGCLSVLILLIAIPSALWIILSSL